jgi:hypothetical protein
MINMHLPSLLDVLGLRGQVQWSYLNVPLIYLPGVLGFLGHLILQMSGARATYENSYIQDKNP